MGNFQGILTTYCRFGTCRMSENKPKKDDSFTRMIEPWAKPGEPSENTAARFNWDSRLSASMIPSFHILIDCLRTNVTKRIDDEFGPDWLFTKPAALELNKRALKKITIVTKQFYNENGTRKSPTSDDLINSLGLWFWVNFFDHKYAPILWYDEQALAMTFPHLPEDWDQATIYDKLMGIEDLREQVFRSVPVYDNDIPIADVYADCRAVIAAMSPAVLKLLDHVDKFPETWAEKVIHVMPETDKDD